MYFVETDIQVRSNISNTLVILGFYPSVWGGGLFFATVEKQLAPDC